MLVCSSCNPQPNSPFLPSSHQAPPSPFLPPSASHLPFPHHTILHPFPTPLLANLVVCGPLHRPHRVALQHVALCVLALVLGARLRLTGVDLAGLGRADLLVGQRLRLRGLPACFGGGHGWLDEVVWTFEVGVVVVV